MVESYVKMSLILIFGKTAIQIYNRMYVTHLAGINETLSYFIKCVGNFINQGSS